MSTAVTVTAFLDGTVVNNDGLPRGAPDLLTHTMLVGARSVLMARLRCARSNVDQDSILSFLAPVSLLMLLPILYTEVLLAYGLAAGRAARAAGESDCPSPNLC